MRKQLKAALAAALALLLALTAIPFSALPRFAAKAEVTPAWTVPAGYNVHDYTKCVEFLEQTDENGVKNGEQLSESYDPNDPETWGSSSWGGEHFQWTAVNGELRVSGITVGDLEASIFGDGYFLGGCLDLSGCTALVALNCPCNNLTELDVTGCTALKYLYCYENSLTELNVSGCTALERLECYSNNLTELDVSGCTALAGLYCSDNNLTELDVHQNTALVGLACRANSLTELDVSQNTDLRGLWCNNNNLTELDVSRNTALQRLWCGNNNLTELDVHQNTALTELECWGNSLTELDVTQNTALGYLKCGLGNLTELDLSNNSGLACDHFYAEGSGSIGYACGEYYLIESFEDWGCDYALYAKPMNGASFEGFYDETGALLSGDIYVYGEVYVYSFDPNTNNEFPTGTITARFSGGVTPGDIDGNGSVTVADAITALRLAMGLLDGSGLNTDAADMDGNGSITIVDAITILRTAMGLA